MKQILRNVILFIVSITVFGCIYIGIFKISVNTVCLLSVIFISYGFCMVLGWKSTEKLQIYEQKIIHFGLTRKDESKILLFSLTSLAPIFFCIILVSLVPLYTVEIWFITVFPCIFLNCCPAYSALGEYYGLTRRKLPFLILFFLLTAIFCLFGFMITWLFF